MYDLLKGLRIIECASFIAAPSCALYLQQMGAEVIRVDPIGGGPDFHRWPVSAAGGSYYWEGLNKGKKSIAVDLGRPEGRQLVVDLVTAPGADSGIFVTNFPKGGFLAHDNLRSVRPDVISVRVMGWNDGGPAVDYTVNAGLGVPFITGAGDLPANEPVNHVLPAWDLVTGAYAAFAMLAAERDRLKTGNGHEVNIPLSDVALAALANTGQVAEVLMSGDRPRHGNALFGAFGRDFTSRDGKRMMVVAITERQWTGLVGTLGLQERVAQMEATLRASFAKDEGARFTHRADLFPLFEQAIASLALTELASRFDAAGVCWSEYRSLSRALREDPRLALAAPLFAQIQHPSGARYPAPGAAATFAGLPRGPVACAPRLGEHTDAVLARVLAMDSARIRQLHQAGLVAGAAQS
jgi:2-methylfumaryl-CoA isomerase